MSLATLLFSCGPSTFVSKTGEEIDLSSVTGKDIFEITQEHSEESPQTLKGTNNDVWIVYYSDINVTFSTEKSSNKIIDASIGKAPLY